LIPIIVKQREPHQVLILGSAFHGFSFYGSLFYGFSFYGFSSYGSLFYGYLFYGFSSYGSLFYGYLFYGFSSKASEQYSPAWLLIASLWPTFPIKSDTGTNLTKASKPRHATPSTH
jgi:hypothetical protein